MAQSRKAIKARIKSIRNTRKITKAMELVAASKMRRAVASALRTRPYAREAWGTMQAILAASPNLTHPLMQAHPDATKHLVIVMSSDRGLAGGLNVNIQRAVQEEIQRLGGKEMVEIIGVGKRGADAVERGGGKVLARFPALTNNPTFADILPVARLALEYFLNGHHKTVSLVYTDFISGISQRPKVSQLLPLSPELAPDKREQSAEFTFEPSPAEVLERVLPALAETMLWQALLESAASEHASRMMAMRNASDAAKDMLTGLTFTYNQARQAGITQEIAEISSGKAALE